ncbi:Ig-like domain-containing protein [Bifidobacterium callimiconis]|uniref:Ig-like domain-containing protein n=1 Tax=Bifidobacterium callimiconis TaxID=2306973 RepID=UPI001BDCD330|nr:Ig-like domain-containing protein [Bifidobacterium callimiconis]MBT1177848.1 Ig-like domain-containing protein [Bifidobacterium callimiconis]
MDLESLRGKRWKTRVVGVVAAVAAVASLGLSAATASAAESSAGSVQTSVTTSASADSSSSAISSASGSSSASASSSSSSTSSSLTPTTASAESTTRITSVDPPSKTTETNSGKKPKLPAKVTAHWSDGSESQASVAWNTSGVDFSNRTGKDRTVTVSGTVCPGDTDENAAGANGSSDSSAKSSTSGNAIGVCEKTADGLSSNGNAGSTGSSDSAGNTAGVSSTSDDTVSVQTSVVVHSAVVTKVAVNGSTSITVASGTKPQLPANAKVSWNDGGDPTTESIDWPQFDGYRERGGGTFTLGGLVAGKTVNVQVTVSPATVKSVDDTVSVTTVVGKAPTMPGTVKVTWSNGDVTEEPVIWDAIPENSYRQPGTFTVSGTVTPTNADGTKAASQTVSAKVSVGTVAYEVQLGDGDGTTTQTESNGTGINVPSNDKTVTTDTRQVVSQSQLSKTGTEVAMIAVVVIVLAVIGAVVVIVVRRRR